METNYRGQLDYRGWCPWFDRRHSARYDKPIVYGGTGRSNNWCSSCGGWALCTEKKSLGFGTGRLYLFYLVLGGYSGYYIYRLE